MLDNLQLEGTPIKQYTDALNWSVFLEISYSYYLEVIRAFHCKSQTFLDKVLIITNLKGVEIRLTPDILAKILHLPTKGSTIFRKYWYAFLNVQKDAVFSELFTPCSTNFVSSHLKLLSKIFNSICQ